MNDHNIFDTGFDKNLQRVQGVDPTISLPLTTGAKIMVGEFQGGGVKDSIEQVSSSQMIISGTISAEVEQKKSGIFFSSKTSFTDTTSGYRMGIDSTTDTFKFVLGNSGSYIDYNVTATNKVTLTGIGTAQLVNPAPFVNSYLPIVADAFGINGTQFVTSFFLPVNMTITGIRVYIGAVGGTDRIYVVLYNGLGAVVANSSLTSGGAVVGSANAFQQLAFTSTYDAHGPQTYFVGVSLNGATAKINTVGDAEGYRDVFSGTVLQTHGTVAAITPPTGFTVNVAPIVVIY